MRAAIRIALLLLAGFLINLVVVLRSVTLSPPTDNASVDLTAKEAAALWAQLGQPVDPDAELHGARMAGITSSLLLVESESHIDDANSWLVEMISLSDYGWPFRSFRGVQHWQASPKGETTSLYSVVTLPGHFLGIPMPGAGTGPSRFVPVEPIWSGLISNVAIYGCVVGVIAWLAMRVRRRALLDRCICPSCRYDLRASMEQFPVQCPECGTAYRGALFARPGSVLRKWMIVYTLPALTLAGTWLLSNVLDSAPELLRIRAGAPMFYVGLPGCISELALILVLLVSCGCMAWSDYADRAPSYRRILAAAVAVALTAGCILPEWILAYGTQI